MTRFILTHQHLELLCQINSFSHNAAPGEMVFFGLRGCLPSDRNASYDELAHQHELMLTEVNYQTPRCTLGQWIPSDGTIAVFPGSTVPHESYVLEQKRQPQNKGIANQMMTGFYRKGYYQGMHGEGDERHEAFRQSRPRPVQRTFDDMDYDGADYVEVKNVFDNLHASRRLSIEERYYSSAGCQVVVGNASLQPGSEAGPWKIFKTRAYGLPQTQYSYLLLPAESVARLSPTLPTEAVPLLRFGSQGDRVQSVQKALKAKGFYTGALDGDFGRGTFEAVIAFQEKTFGADQEDGIFGPGTARALGLDWPKLSLNKP